MKARYYIWGALGGLAVASAPGTPLWALPGLGLLVHMTVDERPDLLMRAWPQLTEGAQQVRGLLADGTRAIRALKPGTEARKNAAPTATPASADPPRQARRAQVQETARRPRWLEVVNDDLDRAPHALIVGPSGAGKTTLATAIMGDRGGRSVVISPKISAGAWSGAEVITLDDDGSYAPLVAAFTDLEDEKRQRIVTLRREGPDALEPITIVLDELQDLTAHVPAAGEFMVNLSSIGREIKMRLVGVGTTDEALNIRGWKASRRNYVRMELDRNRRATLDDSTRTISITPAEVQPLAQRAKLRPWRGTSAVTAEVTAPAQVVAPAPRGVTRPVSAPAEGVSGADAAVSVDALDLLDALLAQPVPSASGRLDTPVPVPVSVPNRAVTDTGTDTPSGGVSLTLERDGGHLTVNVNARAEAAPAERATGRSRTRKGRAFDARRRRQMHQTQNQDAQKAQLQSAYAQRKAAGVSYRKAFAELGGSSEETRAWWRALPEPTEPAKVIRLAERRK